MSAGSKDSQERLGSGVKESTTATLLESKLQLQAMVDELYKKPKAGKPSKDKAALKEALKAVSALDAVDTDYEVNFAALKAAATKGGDQ
jgi:hypothetical protein